MLRISLQRFAQHDSPIEVLAASRAFAQNCLLVCLGEAVQNRRIDIMKAPIVVCLGLLVLPAGVPGQEKDPAGIVRGPKAGFNISAPEGWVVDNEAGVNQGMPCVLYPKGSSWSDAKTVMYANIASPEFEGVNAFVATAIKEMKAKHGTPKEKIASGKTKDGHDYFINEYPATKN